MLTDSFGIYTNTWTTHLLHMTHTWSKGALVNYSESKMTRLGKWQNNFYDAFYFCYRWWIAHSLLGFKFTKIFKTTKLEIEFNIEPKLQAKDSANVSFSPLESLNIISLMNSSYLFQRPSFSESVTLTLTCA